jgi:primosomal replication protein N
LNLLALSASIAEVGALRYTPSGLPALDLRLAHESELLHEGSLRQVKASIKAVAFGAVAKELQKRTIGSKGNFKGFVATPSNGKQVVFHIQEFFQY